MTRRTERVQEAVRRIAGEMMQKELKDPRIADFVTVTRVEVTPDLRLAKIYYTVLGDGKTKKQVARGLASAKPYMRKRIADALKLRYALELSLKPDERAERVERIDNILEKIREEKKNERGRKNNRNA